MYILRTLYTDYSTSMEYSTDYHRMVAAFAIRADDPNVLECWVVNDDCDQILIYHKEV